MQKSLFAAAILAGLGLNGPVVAADMYSSGGLKDGPFFAQPAGWTGFYIGAGGGGGAVNHDIKGGIEGFSGEINGLGGDGGFGTVEVGYDRQFGRVVAGVFFNYDFASMGTKGSINIEDFYTASASYDLDSVWSAGGRVGYLVNESTLAYVLGAYTQASFNASSSLKSIGIGDKEYSGFSVGGGLETALGGRWFLKAEYRFTSLDSATIYQNDGIYVSNQPDIHQGRIVLSYKADIFGHEIVPLK